MSAILSAFEKSTQLSSVMKDVEENTLPLTVTGLSGVTKAAFIGAVCESTGRRALIICENERSAGSLCDDLNALYEQAFFLPAKYFSPVGTEARSRDYEHKKLGVLSKICDREYRFIVCSVEGAAQLNIPQKSLRERCFEIRYGMELKQEQLIQKLLDAGYVRSEMVDGVGQFSRRGEIVDFFSPQLENPVRVDFWGDSIEQIFTFATQSQRREQNIHRIKVVPVRQTLFYSNEDFIEKAEQMLKSISRTKNETLKLSLRQDIDRAAGGIMPADIDRYFPLAYENAQSIFDYCSADLLFYCESAKAEENYKNHEKFVNTEIKYFIEKGVLAKKMCRFYLSTAELEAHIAEKQPIYVDSLPRGSYPLPLKALHNLQAYPIPAWNGTVSQLKEYASQVKEERLSCVVFAGTQKNAKSVYNDLISDGVNSLYFDSLPQIAPEGVMCILGGNISSGFYFPQAGFYLYAQSGQVQSAKKRKAKNKHHRAGEISSLEELNEGDYIVHESYGIGIYSGIEAITFHGVTKDYIKIRYAKDEVLYINVTQLDMVSKYIGSGDNTKVKIHSLSSHEWQRTKQRAKTSIMQNAKELIELYAKRMEIPGYAFPEDNELQSDFELRFPYVETEDQLRCVKEIKRDMCSSHPMDRLLCGDVGFGKTEVALRAAFKAMADGRQVAMLVPTTILAMQHYNTICSRMGDFPLNIEMLSRFRSAAEQKEIKQKLKDGKIDMVVGTHGIISSDVDFRRLGLLIIDEEQRFGVKQKEKLKEKFPKVDVLTLSATPIPRTLSMSLSGIRDMSVIEEAPENRYPIQTFVMEFDFGVMVEAMKRELHRGGQVYYLHNKIEDIEQIANQIYAALPEAKIGIAHGAMNERQLSEIWKKVLNREIDILVCTTIIETGIDVPNVNTLIIENADRMGLAQLHQIRGRVGRSDRRACAYLTYNSAAILTETAQKRLEAIKEFTEFGSGFRIAMRDLEIRGAGNVLGAQQHGQMDAVGYDTYVKLLSEAIAEQRGEQPALSEKECLIDVPISAFIKESYIPSVTQRISMYRRIADIRSEEDATDVLDELEDRFGKPPAEVLNLLKVSLMRVKAQMAGIYEIKQEGVCVIFRLEDFDISVLPRLKTALKRVITLNANHNKPYLSVKTIKNDSVADIIERTLHVILENKE